MQTTRLCPKFHAVLFDATETLFTPHPSVGAVYARVAADFGITLDAAAVDAAFADEARQVMNQLRSDGCAVWENESGARAFWRRLVEALFQRLANRPCSGTCFQAVYDAFEKPDAWRVYDDVVPALDSLRDRGLKLGIVSNFDERLYKVVEALGLLKYFALVLPSTDAGVSKPDPRIFLSALRAMKVRPNAALFIGDDPDTDAAGAAAAGMECLLVDRASESSGQQKRICSLAEIPSYVG